MSSYKLTTKVIRLVSGKGSSILIWSMYTVHLKEFYIKQGQKLSIRTYVKVVN